MDWVSFVGILLFRCTQRCLNIKFGGVKGISMEFVNSLWGSLSSAVDQCVVCDDSIVAYTCIILLDGNFLLMDSGSVENEFVDHYSVCRTFLFLVPNWFFSSVLFFSVMLLFILGQ